MKWLAQAISPVNLRFSATSCEYNTPGSRGSLTELCDTNPATAVRRPEKSVAAPSGFLWPTYTTSEYASGNERMDLLVAAEKRSMRLEVTSEASTSVLRVSWNRTRAGPTLDTVQVCEGVAALPPFDVAALPPFLAALPPFLAPAATHALQVACAAASSSFEKYLQYAADASSRKENMSWCNRSARVIRDLEIDQLRSKRVLDIDQLRSKRDLVQPLCTSDVDNDVRDGQDLKQQPLALVFIV